MDVNDYVTCIYVRALSFGKMKQGSMHGEHYCIAKFEITFWTSYLVVQ